MQLNLKANTPARVSFAVSTAAKPRKAIVIGAGFSGLAAACYLAKAGWSVLVLEKNLTPGGRARHFEAQQFVFDMGPSWYWMPDVFERFFANFGKKVSDYYQLVRLDPSYQIFFSRHEKMVVPAQTQDLEQLFESIEPGSARQLRQFLLEAKYKYEVGMRDFVHRPGHSIWEFADLRILLALFRLQMFTSHAAQVERRFNNEKLRELLKFPVLFLGATPEKTPALYSLMNYADLSLGTWYPMGGMNKIVEAMVSLAKELGVNFEFDAEVVSFETVGKTIRSVRTRKGITYFADVVIGSADYHHLDSQVLEKKHRNYSEKQWNRQVLAPSSLLFYLGISKKLKGLLHHNLFFDEDFKQHAYEIYESPQWPERPLFYVSVPSVTDDRVAPQGCENVFMLIPVAPGLEDNPEIRQKYFDLIVSRLEQHTHQNIRDYIIFKKSYAHNNFVEDYHAFKGNAYGLANTLRQTAFLKPKLKNKNLNNFWYAGQLTVPGPGVPPSLISGEVVAKDVLKQMPTTV